MLRVSSHTSKTQCHRCKCMCNAIEPKIVMWYFISTWCQCYVSTFVFLVQYQLYCTTGNGKQNFVLMHNWASNYPQKYSEEFTTLVWKNAKKWNSDVTLTPCQFYIEWVHFQSYYEKDIHVHHQTWSVTRTPNGACYIEKW